MPYIAIIRGQRITEREQERYRYTGHVSVVGSAPAGGGVLPGGTLTVWETAELRSAEQQADRLNSSGSMGARSFETRDEVDVWLSEWTDADTIANLRLLSE